MEPCIGLVRHFDGSGCSDLVAVPLVVTLMALLAPIVTLMSL